MADSNHYLELADGLAAAAKAARACADEEAGEDSQEKQPKTLRDANSETRKRLRKGRAKAAPDDGDGDEGE